MVHSAAAQPDEDGAGDGEQDMDTDVNAELSQAQEDELRHLGVFALSAASGAVQWKHTGSDYPEAVPGDEILQPQVCRWVPHCM